MTEPTTPETPTPEVLLIDLSSIAYPLWHMNQGDPNPNSTSQKIVEKVRYLARDHRHVAICKDSGRSFRKDLTETYKANRPESDATLQHQIKLACASLAQHYPVWGAPGFEADDVLASAAALAVQKGFVVMLVSDDKDLLQLVDPCVRQYRPTKGLIYDAARVKEEYGVEPGQMTDYLCLVGDTADNVFGAKGIGPKTATVLLQTYGSLVGIYNTLKDHPHVFKPAAAKSLAEFQPRVPLVRQLIELRFDAPVPFAELLEERAPVRPVTTFNPHALDDDEESEMPEPTNPQTPTVPEPCSTAAPVLEFPARMEIDVPPLDPPAAAAPAIHTSKAVARREAVVDAEVMPLNYTRSLDPRNLKEARVMGLDLFNSGLFSAYGSPEGVIATIALGRELGIPMMTALRSIHIIEGKQSLSAQLMVALVLKSGLAEYFEPVELTDTKATWVTHRKGSRHPFPLTHTIQMAEAAGLLRRDRDGNLKESNWSKNPQDMLTARCSSRLARMIYPDVVGNLYTPEELADIREEHRLEARVAGIGA